MKDWGIFPLERNRYFYGKLLTVRDLEMEQRYMNNKRRLINRTVTGAGVVCGLGVTASDDATLMLESGMALDYLGREIVIREPVIRKLQMLDGYEKLSGHATGYLCLRYNQTDTDPVNAVGAEASETHQFNKIEENWALSLDPEIPPYRAVFEAAGEENVGIIYSSDALTAVISIPGAVCGGDEFDVKLTLIKNAQTPPVKLKLSGDASFIEMSELKSGDSQKNEGKDGRLMLEYAQSPDDKRCVISSTFTLKAQSVSGVAGQLFPEGAELHIELGDHVYKNYITVENSVYICADESEYREYTWKQDSLKKRMSGGELPIYLAKLELINSTSGVFIGGVTNLPLGQLLQRQKQASSQSKDKLRITASAESLEYWQKPDVRAAYNAASDSVHFSFAIPSPEVYDFSTSHGMVEIPLTGGSRVNARYYSDEIPHGLGVGNVNVTLALSYDVDGEECRISGSSEVFKSREPRMTPPAVEAAVITYPGRGTMVIGIWLHDNVSGNSVKVHYYAEKPDRDSSRVIERASVSLSVLPEITRCAKLEQIRFKAVITGSEDKRVLWETREPGSGDIDVNGIYKAPETKGTYEVIARSSADPTCTASAFVIVE